MKARKQARSKRASPTPEKRQYSSLRSTRAKVFIPLPENTYIALNKPYGVLSQFSSPADSPKPTLSSFGFPAGIYPVGRLDHDSEGLLLLTNDTRLNAALLHPARKHARTYLVQVERIPSQDALKALQAGVIIGGFRTAPAQVIVLPGEPLLPPRPVSIRYRRTVPTAWLDLTITEGKNRQVRRMTAAVGHPTLRLVRVAIGQLHLNDLELSPGQWARLSIDQVLKVFG